MLKRAVVGEHVAFRLINPRDFTCDKHRITDDRPFGGGPGMIMKPEPLTAAVESVQTESSRVILLSPSGAPFNQPTAQRLSESSSSSYFYLWPL